MRRFPLTLVVAVLVLLVAVPAVAHAARSVPPRFYGSNWDADIQRNASLETWDREAARMAASGVESMRTNFEWAVAQHEEEGAFDFAKTDVAVAAAARHGMDVLPVVILAPEWARKYPHRVFSPPAKPAEYAAYLKALVDRYGPSGTFWTQHPEFPKLPIRYWEIWNEIHLQYQWDTPADARDDWRTEYGPLLRKSYRTIKKADPGAKVVLAGLTNFSWRNLSALYKYSKIKGSFDVAAVHPYTSKFDGAVKIVERFRTVMRNRGDRSPIWVTELGLPASRGRVDSDSNLQTTDAGMATWLTASYRGLARNWKSKIRGAKRVYWYTWATTYCCEAFRFSGLLQFDEQDQSVEPMPAYDAYVNSARKYEGCIKNEAGQCAP